MTYDSAHGPEWLDWLAARLGTRQWVVAPRLTDRLRDKGYTLAVSQKLYRELQAEFAGATQSPR